MASKVRTGRNSEEEPQHFLLPSHTTRGYKRSGWSLSLSCLLYNHTSLNLASYHILARGICIPRTVTVEKPRHLARMPIIHGTLSYRDALNMLFAAHHSPSFAPHLIHQPTTSWSRYGFCILQPLHRSLLHEAWSGIALFQSVDHRRPLFLARPAAVIGCVHTKVD